MLKHGIIISYYNNFMGEETQCVAGSWYKLWLFYKKVKVIEVEVFPKGESQNYIKSI